MATSTASLIAQPSEPVVPGCSARMRRPISVCDYDEKTLTIVYKVVGKGTAQMAAMQAGETLDILTGLGNGYDLSLTGDAPVLLGGGVGVPPMYNLAKKLL